MAITVACVFNRYNLDRTFPDSDPFPPPFNFLTFLTAPSQLIHQWRTARGSLVSSSGLLGCGILQGLLGGHTSTLLFDFLL